MTAPDLTLTSEEPRPRRALLGRQGDSVGTGSVEKERLDRANLLRRQAFDLLDLLHQISDVKSLRGCCRYRIKGAGNVEIRRAKATGAPYLAGIQRCGSVWLCPVCSSKVAGTRRQEIERVGRAHQESGGSIAFLTLTVRHDAGMEARALRKAVSACWRAVQQGQAYRREVKRLGLLGTLRTLEVTHGANGFHPHLHLALFFQGNIKPAFVPAFTYPDGRTTEAGWTLPPELSKLAGIIYRLWSGALARRGYPKPSEEHGCRMQLVTPGSEGWMRYLAKMGFEFTPTHKQGRGTNRSMWEVANDAGVEAMQRLRAGLDIAALTVDGEVVPLFEDLRIWWDYERMIKGARQLEWSRKLKKHYAVADQTDLELANEEPADSEVLVELPGALWRSIVRRPSGRAQLLEAAWSGRVGIWQLFESWGEDVDVASLYWGPGYKPDKPDPGGATDGDDNNG